MSTSERIYGRLPAPVQSLAVTVRGMRLASERYGRAYWRRRRELPGIFALSRAELEALQMRELRRLVEHAARSSPYHREALAGIDPASLRTVDDLRRLPVLEKETLRARAADVYTLPLSRSIEGHTGGTTGKSLVVAFTRGDYQRRFAELDHFKAAHGARNGMRRATFSGKHILGRDGGHDGVFWRTNWVLRQRFYSTFHMSPDNLPRYVEDLERFRPQIIDGFVSCIADLCAAVRARGRPLSYRPVAVFPTSEPLYPHQRELMREVFGVEPRDQYASSEGAPFVTECPRGRMHYLLHTGVIETDESGDSLVTAFATYGTPLIRYRIGDRIAMDEGAECGCGWDTPLVRSIEGRSIDYLFTPERGRIYSPNMANVVKNLPNAVVQAQFVQDAPDRIQVRLVVDPSRYVADQHAPIVRQEVHNRLGDAVRVDLELVPAIAREASGKQRLVLNLCGAGAGTGEGDRMPGGSGGR